MLRCSVPFGRAVKNIGMNNGALRRAQISLNLKGKPMEISKATLQSVKTIKPEQKPTTDKEDKKLKESAKQLEGLFLTFMLKAMEKTVPKFDDKKNSNNLASMMFSMVLGQDLSEKGGVGLADFIYKNMKEHQDKNIQIPTQNWIGIISDNKLISGRNHDQ